MNFSWPLLQFFSTRRSVLKIIHKLLRIIDFPYVSVESINKIYLFRNVRWWWWCREWWFSSIHYFNKFHLFIQYLMMCSRTRKCHWDGIYYVHLKTWKWFKEKSIYSQLRRRGWDKNEKFMYRTRKLFRWDLKCKNKFQSRWEKKSNKVSK